MHEPCPRCPVGPACRGLVHRRDCEHVAAGVPGYVEMLRRLAESPAPQEAPPVESSPAAVACSPIAPLRQSDGRLALDYSQSPWEGSIPRKPWHYPVTVAIVHLDAPRRLRCVLACLRAQTVAPYFLVIDTGSLAPALRELEALEADEDLEVHRLRSKSWRFSSEPVAVAMDLAFAICHSERLIATHDDVFPIRRDLVEWVSGQCDSRTPAVGYQMSPRPASGNRWWERTLSHTFTCYHLPTMRRIGATWNMQAAMERSGLPLAQPDHTGWPDTETNLGMVLHGAGVGVRWPSDPPPGPNEPPSVLMIGAEENVPYSDANLAHVRSSTCHQLYNRPEAERNAARLDREMLAAYERVDVWRRRASKPRVPLGSAPGA